mmetsp:Transcript_42131/g.98817  ORF Transcript_42131/g.98817 Transcript_42131/m.98817 type:complete len:217 (+) Transcript_42131:144-794(+)
MWSTAPTCTRRGCAIHLNVWCRSKVCCSQPGQVARPRPLPAAFFRTRRCCLQSFTGKMPAKTCGLQQWSVMGKAAGGGRHSFLRQMKESIEERTFSSLQGQSPSNMQHLRHTNQSSALHVIQRVHNQRAPITDLIMRCVLGYRRPVEKPDAKCMRRVPENANSAAVGTSRGEVRNQPVYTDDVALDHGQVHVGKKLQGPAPIHFVPVHSQCSVEGK